MNIQRPLCHLPFPCLYSLSFTSCQFNLPSISQKCSLHLTPDLQPQFSPHHSLPGFWTGLPASRPFLLKSILLGEEDLFIKHESDPVILLLGQSPSYFTQYERPFMICALPSSPHSIPWQPPLYFTPNNIKPLVADPLPHFTHILCWSFCLCLSSCSPPAQNVKSYSHHF